MRQDNLISVIIPVKNGSNYISEALTGIKTQNVNVEIIVVDDNSTDNTSEIAVEHKCTLLKHTTTMGQVIGKNTGLKAANGNFIMFHDHDDILTNNALKIMSQELLDNKDLEVVIAKIQDFISSDASKQNQNIKQEPYYGCLAGSLLIKKSVFDKIGLFEENITAGEIISLTSKFEEYGIKTKKIDFISSKRRIHDTNYGKTNKHKELKDYASILRAKLKRQSI